MPKRTFIKYFEDADDVIMTRGTGLVYVPSHFQPRPGTGRLVLLISQLLGSQGSLVVGLYL